jgi:hypothetical protein
METTETYPTEAEVMKAEQEFAVADAFLNDPTQPTADLAGKRREMVDQKIEAAKVLQRHEAKPRPLTGPPGPPQADREAAALRNAAYSTDILKFPQGSEAAKIRMRQYYADSAIVNAPGPREEVDLDFDVHQAPLPKGMPTLTPPIPLELPALANGKQWPMDRLEEGQKAADATGFSPFYLPLLHLIKHALDEGGGWTGERILEHWTQRHGAEKAQDLVGRALAFDQAVLQHAPKFKRWVEREGGLSPEVIEYALGAWERLKR